MEKVGFSRKVDPDQKRIIGKTGKTGPRVGRGKVLRRKEGHRCDVDDPNRAPEIRTLVKALGDPHVGANRGEVTDLDQHMGAAKGGGKILGKIVKGRMILEKVNKKTKMQTSKRGRQSRREIAPGEDEGVWGELLGKLPSLLRGAGGDV